METGQLMPNPDGKAEFPSDLRHVLVYVWTGGEFPPSPNSTQDIALLRAANRALIRKSDGVTDAFLFLFAIPGDLCEQKTALRSYGFLDPCVESLDLNYEQDEGEPDYDELSEEVSDEVARWLRKEHTHAIPFSNGTYDPETFWWGGIEMANDQFDWPFEARVVERLLPKTQVDKADTWLSILGNAMQVDVLMAEAPFDLAQQRIAAMAATLCEWLHGFEAASGNSFNGFEPDTAAKSLGLSDFFLGFEAARLSGSDLEGFCDAEEKDFDQLRGSALSQITQDLRIDVACGLSNFFGGDTELFWALHSTVWPCYGRPMREGMDELVSLQTRDYSDLECPWRFVTEGWDESADR
jgi:hypothetical protein